MRMGAYLDSKRVMHYHEMGLVHKNERKIYHMHHQTEYEITYGTHDISLKFIFILSKTSLMLSPPKANLSFMNWSHIFHYFGIMKINYCLSKIKRNRRLFANRNGIKIVRVKTGFLELKLKS